MRFDLDTVFGVHEKAMIIRSQRAQVLAENLANADTPNYKAKDIDFKSMFETAKGEFEAGNMSSTNSQHFGFKGGVKNEGSFSVETFDRISTQPSMDGNTVDTQVEQSAFLRNAMEYQVSIRLLNGTIKGLMSAIRGE